MKTCSPTGALRCLLAPLLSLAVLWPSLAVAAPAPAQPPPSATIEDAIAMERILWHSAADGSVAAVSPDGTRFATVTWHGDLNRNVNVYSVRVGALNRPDAPPKVVLTRDFVGDPLDQHASPISEISFLADNHTITYIGREGGAAPAQVYTVNVDTGAVRQLTHSPTPVRTFAVDPSGELRVYSAPFIPESDSTRNVKLDGDGVFIWDPAVFSWHPRFFTSASVVNTWDTRQIRQYYLTKGGSSQIIYDSRTARSPTQPTQERPDVLSGTLEQETILNYFSTLTADNQGRYALVFPYAEGSHPMAPERYTYFQKLNDYARRVAAPYGLVDLQTGQIDRLIDAPHPQFDTREAHGGGPPVWSPDGRSVVIYSLLPWSSETAKDDCAQMPCWLEVDLATRKYTRLPVPPQWKVLRWDQSLVLSEGEQFGRLERHSDGSWSALKTLGGVSGLASRDFPVSTNGRVVLGVKMAPTQPPELVAYDLKSARTRILTDLNPHLRTIRYGAVESIQWADRKNSDNAAFLVRPVGYEPEKRYPLIILFDDNTLPRVGEPYLLDAHWQLSGHAIQMLAAQGFVVAYTHEPRSLHESIETKAEGEEVCDFVETLVAKLDRQGLIDPRRVGISGWSRGGYHTDYLLIHSKIPFAAATTIDGGGSEYNEGNRPFTDAELQKIRTPLLIEPHGQSSLVMFGPLADRLDALGKPVELLYFATASHSTTRPQHRYRSLSTHIDWWRFWLQGQEDPDPAKQPQYARWRELKKQQAGGS